MSDEATIRRSLKIKTGVVKRLTKESISYHKELGGLQVKADQLSTEDTWEAKNAKNLVVETVKALDLTNAKLKDEISGLRDLVVSVENDERIKGDEAFSAAKLALEAAEASLEAKSRAE